MIEKALDRDNIDEIIRLSKEYRETLEGQSGDGHEAGQDRRYARRGETLEEQSGNGHEAKQDKRYIRRGKTRMPKRLVRTEILFDLGYPYHEQVRDFKR